MTRVEEILRECCRSLAPPQKKTVSEWCEENFILSPEYSAVTGPLKLYRFQRDIVDAFADPYVAEIVVMSATQLVKTLAIQCCICYAIVNDPGPILVAQPTETDAETFSKERIAPMIRDIECLRIRVAPEKRTSKANTTLHKVFPGGSLTLIGAQTAGNFARRSIRYFFADERDKWPRNVGKEGDGYSLGVKRQATFRSRAKRMQTCSPTIEGDSQIAAAYEASDQRKFYVPCPQCGEYQVLRWERVIWEPTDPAGTARYKCSSCDALWDDVRRWDACERGEWRAERPFAGIAGFWISELYSPWKRLSDIVSDFLAKKDDPAQLQTFVNTSLAETWRQQGEAPDYEKLMSRRESGVDGRPAYRLGQVPEGVLFLTAGTDTQKTWLEGYVWGWGRGKQRWLIDHYRIDKNPFDVSWYDEHDEIINRTYRHPSGAEISIVCAAIDTGYATNEIYGYARRHPGRVIAVDGRATGVALVGAPTQVDVTVGGRRIKRGCKLWPVNVSMAKSELYGLLSKERPSDGEPYPPGWVHFPADADEEFFKQFTAEQLVYRVVKGYRKHEWVKTRERNEALDCCVYARAAAFVFGMDRMTDREWAKLEGQLSQRKAEPKPQVIEPPRAVRVIQPEERVVTSSYIMGFLR